MQPPMAYSHSQMLPHDHVCSCAPGETGAIQPMERVGNSSRPVASVAGASKTATTKRTPADDKACIEFESFIAIEA
jgi:hypothetical protein